MRTYYDPQDPRRAQHAHSAPPRQARRRKRRRGSPALCLALALFLIGGALSLGRRFTPPPLEQLSPAPSQSVEEETGDVGDDLQAQLQALSQEKPRARDILSHLEDYPRELLELAVRNPETVDFVADYPQEKDRVPAETVEEAERGTIPLLLQWDPRWGYAQYGDGPMALNGCGPTALSMVICGLTGDGTATPYAVAQYAQEMGYYVDGVGTSWELMSAGGARFGVTARELPLSQSVMENALAAGEPIICSVGPGDFTTSGHFIVLAGLEDGKFQVRDPNRRSTSEKLWDYDTLAGQITNLWAFSLA